MLKFLSICPAIVIITILVYAQSSNQTVSNFDKYERYFDSIDSLPYGNYFLIQPGLFKIANQMPKEYGQMRIRKEGTSYGGAYPTILNGNIDFKNHIKIDTFKYNWGNDTILCINKFGRRYISCELISSIDSVIVSNTYHVSLDRECKTTFKENRKFLKATKEWDNKMFDTICINRIDDGDFYGLGRLIINDGILIDVKYIGCDELEIP